MSYVQLKMGNEQYFTLTDMRDAYGELIPIDYEGTPEQQKELRELATELPLDCRGVDIASGE